MWGLWLRSHPRYPDRGGAERSVAGDDRYRTATLDGFASCNESGDWGGYWGKQGPEFLEHRLANCREEQRMVLGANTFRHFVELLGPIDASELDPVNARMKTMPTTAVSTTLLELIESRTFDGHIQELIYRPTLHR